MPFFQGVIPAACAPRVRAGRAERRGSHVTVHQDAAGLFVIRQQHRTPVRTAGQYYHYRHTSGPSYPPPLTRLPFCCLLVSDVLMARVSRRVSPTAVSAAKATRVSTAIDGRSLQPAEGCAVDTGSVACQKEESLSASVSQDTPDPPVKQVKRGRRSRDGLEM